jgi:plasmid stability protein
MAAITIRKLSDETHRALKARATQHGRSTEAEVRLIIEAAVWPPDRLRLGEVLSAIGREVQLTEEEFKLFDDVRDRTPHEPLDLT